MNFSRKGTIILSGRYIMYEAQKKYFTTEKGSKALKKAQKNYDESDIERRRRQKREYMRRKRMEDPLAWRYKK